MFFGNVDTIMKYLGLELSLGVCVRGMLFLFFHLSLALGGMLSFSFVAGLILREIGNDLILNRR